ncbi:hypothetical protein M011DRAFT_488559 [Sporormia fimetaria CBS 119925]|uniref:Amidoligase enzyme n=1 Tax=Sporormia fimetaria CBS 119925 TaxID=1340428 RepID=A0A6A6V4P7_9PLEO|nr:hypothetical protein M011DRAFT_488559 [Sporormia fimetaria CBS 119925]
MASGAPVDFRFGVEIEVVLPSRHSWGTYTSWAQCAQALSGSIQRRGVANNVSNPDNKPNERYERWALVEEPSIPSLPYAPQISMEGVSPVYQFGTAHAQETWKSQIKEVWAGFTQFSAQAAPGCSTHVHLSPSSARWTLPQVKAIAKAALYFEPCIDAIMPAHRVRPAPGTSDWCASSRQNAYGRQMGYAQQITNITNAPSVEYAIYYMNALSLNFQNDIRSANVSPYFRWNFTGLGAGGKGTIEFRQPPGSKNENETTAWVMFTGCFVRAVLEYETDNMYPRLVAADTGPGLNNKQRYFKEFVKTGANLMGYNEAMIAWIMSRVGIA